MPTESDRLFHASTLHEVASLRRPLLSLPDMRLLPHIHPPMSSPQRNDQNDVLLGHIAKAARSPISIQESTRQTLESLTCIRPNGLPDHPYIGPTWYLMASYRDGDIPITAGGINDLMNELELLLQITPEMKAHLNTLPWEQRNTTALTKAIHFMDAR